MNKAKTDFDKPAKDFIFILTVFNEHMEQELYAENICFILNKLMPVVYNAAVIGVTRESNDAIDKFKRNLIRKHCREFRPMEVLYELNLFYPFSLLLNWGIYRHHILYKYANLIKLYYKIWGRLYRWIFLCNEYYSLRLVVFLLHWLSAAKEKSHLYITDILTVEKGGGLKLGYW